MGKWPFFKKKPWINNLEKTSIFRLFKLLLFIAENSALLLQNILKHPFLDYISSKKKKIGKKQILHKNHQSTPLQKSQFFDFFTSWFLQPRKAFYRSRVSQNTLSWPIMPKKKVEKMATFGPKPWVNPFRKMSIFVLFGLLVFIAQKGVVSFQNCLLYTSPSPRDS